MLCRQKLHTWYFLSIEFFIFSKPAAMTAVALPDLLSEITTEISNHYMLTLHGRHFSCLKASSIIKNDKAELYSTRLSRQFYEALLSQVHTPDAYVRIRTTGKILGIIPRRSPARGGRYRSSACLRQDRGHCYWYRDPRCIIASWIKCLFLQLRG